MAIDIQFQPIPVLNVDESRLAWFNGLDDTAKRDLKISVKNKTFEYLQEALFRHSSVLPMPGQVLLIAAPLRWEFRGKRYSTVILAYSTLDNVEQVLHLVTHMAITDWRSELMVEMRQGTKDMGNPIRYNMANIFISPQDSEMAELITKAVHGLERSSGDEGDVQPERTGKFGGGDKVNPAQ